MLQEIANQKGVSCRAQGWKVHLCAAQLLQLVGGARGLLRGLRSERRVQSGFLEDLMPPQLRGSRQRLVCCGL